MNSPTKLIPLILAFMMCATIQISASPCNDCAKIPGEDCKECDGKGGEKNKWLGTTIPGEDCKECDGAGGEKNKDPGALIRGERCKECDGNGGVREKKDGTVVFKNLRKGYCCGGVWHDAGPKPPGCFKLSPPSCKWETYTPDCKVHEDRISALKIYIYKARIFLKALVDKLALAKWCCACENGEKWACLLTNGGRCKQWGMEKGCDSVDEITQDINNRTHLLNLAYEDLKRAKKRLDDCQNCRK